MQKSPKSQNTPKAQSAPKSLKASKAPEEFDVAEIKANLKIAKASVQEILNEEDCPQIFELFEAVIDNAEDSLKKIKKSADIDSLSIKEQARIFADLNMFSSVAMQIDSMLLDDEDADYDDDDDDFEEDESLDEDTEDEDEDEDSEDEDDNR